jgi:hypothetical protein
MDGGVNETDSVAAKYFGLQIRAYRYVCVCCHQNTGQNNIRTTNKFLQNMGGLKNRQFQVLRHEYGVPRNISDCFHINSVINANRLENQWFT